MILFWFLIVALALAWGIADFQLEELARRAPPPPPPTPTAVTQPVAAATDADLPATDLPVELPDKETDKSEEKNFDE